ncbi:hypothetical protein EV426DRAFT_643444 [Tirmania nivea]|nr:hypothetical protein EV426DRAFT_643444 [Tirmania nivea]
MDAILSRHGCALCHCPGGSTFNVSLAQNNTCSISPCADCQHAYSDHAPEPTPPPSGSLSTRDAHGDKGKRVVTPPGQRLDRSRSQQKKSPPMKLDGSLCPRHNTVRNLLSRILANHVVLVRGTPASGKSTLLRCLYWYIQNHPELAAQHRCFRINCWARDDVQSAGGWRSYILAETDGDLDLTAPDLQPYILCIDEAQTSYWDIQFWTDFIKDIAQTTPLNPVHHIVLFSSYGSLNAADTGDATPPFLTPSQNVSLLPQPGEQFPLGLLFDIDEFSDTLQRTIRAKGAALLDINDADMVRLLFEVTQGHPGALISIVYSIYHFEPFKNHIKRGTKITIADLCEKYFFSIQESFSSLRSTPFCRGLPKVVDIQQHKTASVLEYILLHKCLPLSTALTWLEDMQETVNFCHRQGWIHLSTHSVIDSTDASTHQPPHKQEASYVLASKLHEWYVSSLLLFELSLNDSKDHNEYPMLSAFCIATIRRFRPSILRQAAQLGAPTAAGPGTSPRPVEAVYQDEFYRCAYQVLRGRVGIIPEWGTAAGRIDFFIPDRKWGVEVLRDGVTIGEHVRRFTGGGAYTHWLNLGLLTDYMILDFRGNIVKGPLRRTPTPNNVLRIIFEEEYRIMIVQDGLGSTVEGPIRLLEGISN